jgi:hypothetical protein
MLGWPDLSMSSASDRSEMSTRLGDVLYRTACLAAVVWAAFVLVVTATLALPDWTIATPIAAVGALVIWSFGRAAGHFLTNR